MQYGGGDGCTGLCQAVLDPQQSGCKLLSFSRLREKSGKWGKRTESRVVVWVG